MSAGLAASAAVGLIAGVCILLVPALGIGVRVPRRMDLFAGLAFTMAGGVSVPSLLFGGAVRKTADIPRDVGFLLAGAGILLLPPMGVEILGVVASVRTPAWVLFPIVGVVALDMVAIGYRVSPEVT